MKVRWEETLNEMKSSKDYQYRVVNYNNQLDRAAEEVLQILKQTKSKRKANETKANETLTF